MKYSVITINYNNRDGLQRTIESVVSQTCHDFEFIVIDGDSTDGSVELINTYSDRIDYWVSEPDKGIYDAMNKGIAKSSGEWLNFMNSGDCFYDNHVLENVTPAAADCDILVGRDFHYNKATDQGFATILPPRLSMLTFYMATLPHQSSFFRRELFDNNPYDTGLRICSDWLFYIQSIVCDGCRVKMTDEIICHREPDGICNAQNDRMKTERETVLTQLLPRGVRADYDTLAHLDRSTLYKLLDICEQPKAARWLTFCIKVIYRLFTTPHKKNR